MGFNTIFAVKAADLDKIALDEDFGMKLSTCVRMSDTRSHLNPDDMPGSGIFLDNLVDVLEEKTDYNIQVGESRHADETKVHIIKDGVFLTLDWHRTSPWHVYDTAARTLAKFGFKTALKSGGYTIEPAPVDRNDHKAEWQRMDGYSDDTFNGALITFVLLNDATDDIRKDKTLGHRLASFAREWWELNKYGRNILREGVEKTPFGYINDTISSGHHGNPISIVAVTPAGAEDIIVIGQNCGRVISPCCPVDEAYRQSGDKRRMELLSKLEKQDLTQIKNALLQAGFLVRSPGKTRSESPSFWNEANYVKMPVAEENDKDAGPQHD
jgi:hypothetical protein